jgi:hypothetical protein
MSPYEFSRTAIAVCPSFSFRLSIVFGVVMVRE